MNIVNDTEERFHFYQKSCWKDRPKGDPANPYIYNCDLYAQSPVIKSMKTRKGAVDRNVTHFHFFSKVRFFAIKALLECLHI